MPEAIIKDNIERVGVEKLIPYPNNPKEHPDEQVDKIAGSIQEYGFIQPLVVDDDNQVIIGHGRLLASKKLGLDKVPVIRSEDLTDAQKKALRIADNRIAESGWDNELLSVELEELEEVDYDLDILGFEEDELLDLKDENVGVEEDGFDIEVDEDGDDRDVEVKPGDVYELGPHRLVCGDATSEEDVEVLMDGEKADMVFTDPPYGVGYGSDQEELQEKSGGKFSKKRAKHTVKNDDLSSDECAENIWYPTFLNMYHKSKPDCSIYITTLQSIDQIRMIKKVLETGWDLKHQLIWNKNAQVFSMGRLDYDYKHEPIIFGWKDKHNFYGKGDMVTSVWDINKTHQSTLHPTMKPIELISNALKNSSKQGDIVIDFFGGSGSTLIACEQLDRRCYMMEIDPQYCQVIIDRWEEFTGQEAEQVGDNV